ncbi:MAG: AI-2E family transporter, partial [Xanthobacteraceae bacterium]
MSELILRKLERPTDQNSESTLKTVLIGVVVVVALYLGRDVLVPIALAVLLTFVLAPLVRLLQGLYFPRIIAVAVVGLFAFAAIFGLGALMMSQVNQLAADSPRYQSTLGDTPFVASDERLPALSLSFPCWKCRLDRRTRT